MTNILYGLLISLSFVFNQTALSSEQPAPSLIKKENLSTVSFNYKDILSTIEAPQQLQDSVSEIQSAANSYYNNLNRYFGFRIMATILENKIENNYQKYQGEIQKYIITNSNNPLTNQIKMHDIKLKQDIVSWRYLKRLYASYPGHIL